MCAKFRFNEGDIRKVQANIKAWNEKQIQKYAFALKAWTDELTGEIQGELLESKAVDQGILYAAQYTQEVERDGSRLRSASVNPSAHATAVEFGRKPGSRPPLLALVGWAYRRGFLKALPANVTFDGPYRKQWAASAAIMKRKRLGKGTATTKQKKELDPIIRDMIIVRSIAQAIYEKGSPARHSFSRAFDRKAANFINEIAELVRMLK